MTAVIIPMVKKPAEPRRCSFCARSEDKVKKLVASSISSHCICDQCIARAKQAIADCDSTSGGVKP
jgi:hypothetical protein